MRVSLFFAAIALAGTGAAQQGSPDPNVVFRSQGSEVLLEVVFRDRHGKQITKIDPSQVSVFEDGVKQNVTSFRLVSGKEARQEARTLANKAPVAVAGTPSGAPRNPLRTVNIVCLILGDLSPDNRGFAFDAASKFVNNELRPDTFIGIFSMDSLGIRPVLPFSNNREHLLQAIRLASVNQLPAIQQSTAAVLSGLSMTAFAGSGAAPSGPDNPSVQNPLGTRGAMEEQIIEGLREIDALKRLVTQLSELPFQKTVLLMSSGLTRPPDQLEYWDSLIKAANRGGVTFYGLDINGLCPTQFCDSSPSAASSAYLAVTAGLSQSQSTAGMPPRGPNSPGGSSVQGPSLAEQAMNAMHQDDYLRFGVLSANKQEALREISESTGGFLIATNNTEGMLAKVMDDVDTHYELSYKPTAPSFDGHFKKIEVKIARTDLRVETRRGYYAVPDTGDGPLTAGDFAALQAVDSKTHEFEFQSKAFHFGSDKYAIAWEVPVSNLTSTPEEGRKLHRFHAYLLALVKNAQGEIVDRASKDVPSEVRDILLPAIEAEPMIYEHVVSLPPGKYTVDTAVVDEEGNRSSARAFPLESVAEPLPGLSDIVLVRRVNPLDRPPDPNDPFEVPGKRAQPYLSDALPANAAPYVYFVVYPEPNGPDPSLRVQFLKNGRALATQKSPLPHADASGAVPMAIQPPAGPGDYEVRVTIEQGRKSTQRNLRYSSK